MRRSASPRTSGGAEHAAALRQLEGALAAGEDRVAIELEGVELTLTQLQRTYFPRARPPARRKGDLLRYYLTLAPTMLPHLAERPTVLTRYPNGTHVRGVYIQRAPESRPAWVTACRTCVKPPKEVDYLTIGSTTALLWAVNLGTVEFHPWYSRCSAPTRPDYLAIDLDPVAGTRFERVRSAALLVRDALEAWGLPGFVKTSGASGLHLFVPIERGPVQREVHDVARDMAVSIEAMHPSLFTTEYRVANRPRGRILLDYKQNAPGHHLAGPYVVRPTPTATVSMPVEWEELEAGVMPSDFTIGTVAEVLGLREDAWSVARLQGARADLRAWRDAMVTTPRRRLS